MGKFVRKNLLLDADELRELAQRRGTSESALVRELVKQALGYEEMADEMMDAIEKLRASGGVDDVFGRLPKEVEDELDARATP